MRGTFKRTLVGPVRIVYIGLNDNPAGPDPFCIVEAWDQWQYRGPFHTRYQAAEHAQALAEYYDYPIHIEHTEDPIIHLAGPR